MPEVQCMTPTSPNNTGYVLLVQLTTWQLLPVLSSIRPGDGIWYWVNTDNPSNHDGIIKIPGNRPRYVSRTLYHGYYLPGWALSSQSIRFRAVDYANSKSTNCLYGELLAFHNSSEYVWISYRSGHPLPDCALSLFNLPDGTQLYIVKYERSIGSANAYLGFYNDLPKSTYFVNKAPLRLARFSVPRRGRRNRWAARFNRFSWFSTKRCN